MSTQRQIAVPIQTKVVVTVAEMARMVGLSRARFYQLVTAGTFPAPLYDVTTRRPLFVEQQQEVCLEVRRRNCGVNGKAVLFYARRISAVTQRASASTSTPKRVTTKPASDPLVESIKALGLASATAATVRAAVAEVFPNGATGIDQGVVIRAVFLHLKRRNTADSAG